MFNLSTVQTVAKKHNIASMEFYSGLYWNVCSTVYARYEVLGEIKNV